MSAPKINDYDSPGYEYLRSYQSMNNLYHKLVALNYHKDFCSRYKCPPIHKYYFAAPDKNHLEQEFIFTCLSAWLIKEKCQMNLDLEPDEYEDPETNIGIILEAVRLLLISDEENPSRTRKDGKSVVKFNPGRLKQGYGPEVIWTLNILTDRAIEMMLSNPQTTKLKSKIVYHNNNADGGSIRPSSTSNSITVGQPHVGGGLTTRPLGNYQIDDADLLLDECEDENRNEPATEGDTTDEVNPEIWYNQVEQLRPVLEEASTRLNDEENRYKDWQSHIHTFLTSKQAIHDFLNESSSLMEVISGRVDRQLKVINTRENFIQTSLSDRIEDFLKVYRQYSLEKAKHESLMEQVNFRTDKFEGYSETLKEINLQVELRKKELSDGGKLRDLEAMINRLRDENVEFDVKIGLLLTVYAKIHSRIVSTSDRPASVDYKET